MDNKRMTRDKAFDIAGQALNLAQDIGYHVHLRNPKFLKRRFRWFANKAIFEEVKKNYDCFVDHEMQAYALYNELMEWADTYPIEGEQK